MEQSDFTNSLSGVGDRRILHALQSHSCGRSLSGISRLKLKSDWAFRASSRWVLYKKRTFELLVPIPWWLPGECDHAWRVSVILTQGISMLTFQLTGAIAANLTKEGRCGPLQ